MKLRLTILLILISLTCFSQTGKVAGWNYYSTGTNGGAAFNYNRSIFENSPAIPGYTSLIGQILGLSSTGTASQKNGAQYVITKYGAYSTNLTNMINQYYQQGINWIQH